jgi:hypothetical protein
MPMTGVTDDADDDKHDDDGHDHVINDDSNDDACNKYIFLAADDG